jgi:hypothetical protein
MMTSKRFSFFRVLATIILTGLFLAACSPRDQLIGVWHEAGGDLHFRFHTGNFISQRAYFDEDTLTLTGTYEIINDSQINITFEDGEWRGLKSGLYDFSIDGDELRLDDMVFERQPDVYSGE